MGWGGEESATNEAKRLRRRANFDVALVEITHLQQPETRTF